MTNISIFQYVRELPRVNVTDSILVLEEVKDNFEDLKNETFRHWRDTYFFSSYWINEVKQEQGKIKIISTYYSNPNSEKRPRVLIRPHHLPDPIPKSIKDQKSL
jgi:hypothetical protein